jgi:hypothetical protein
MRIAITVDEVLRDTIGQMHYTYEKYVGELDISESDIKDPDLSKTFKFQTKELYNKFLYEAASVEIFGHADQKYPGVFEEAAEFLFDFYDDNEHEIVIIAKEHGRSVGATLFFFSKVNNSFRDFKFIDSYDKIWDDFDIIITATPELLNLKPENKTSVKVITGYNKKTLSDFKVKTLGEALTNPKMLDKIIKNKKNKL